MLTFEKYLNSEEKQNVNMTLTDIGQYRQIFRTEDSRLQKSAELEESEIQHGVGLIENAVGMHQCFEAFSQRMAFITCILQAHSQQKLSG